MVGKLDLTLLRFWVEGSEINHWRGKDDGQKPNAHAVNVAQPESVLLHVVVFSTNEGIPVDCSPACQVFPVFKLKVESILLQCEMIYFNFFAKVPGPDQSRLADLANSFLTAELA